MSTFRASTCLILSVLCGGFLAHAQQEARIETTQGVITAGDKLELKVALSKPTGCATSLRFYFRDAKTTEQFQIYGDTDGKGTELQVASPVAKDVPGGEYKLVGGEINPCPGYSKWTQLKTTETTVVVKPFPDLIQPPASADVKLTLTQTQFLQTEMTRLSILRGRLDTLEQNSDPSQLRSLLLAILNEAEDDLTAAQDQYRKRILQSQTDSLPLFFLDFHVQYQALRNRLTALTSGQAENASSSAKLMYVQLRKRSDGGDLLTKGSPEAEQLRHLIKDNAKAYNIVKETGQAKFHARLSSYPMGARVSYKNALDNQYMDYSSPTNVSWATFDLAYWDFKFHKDGCPEDQFRRVNPYEDSDPADISVEFLRCKPQ